MLAAKGLDDARRQPALRVVARSIPYHLFFVRQLRIEQQRIVPMKVLTCHIPAYCPLVGTKHRTVPGWYAKFQLSHGGATGRTILPSGLFVNQHARDAAVRNEPHQRHQQEGSLGHRGRQKTTGKTGRAPNWWTLAFPIPAGCSPCPPLRTLLVHVQLLKDPD